MSATKVLDKSPTYYLLLDSYLQAVRQGKMVSGYKESADALAWRQVEGSDTFRSLQDIVVFAKGLLLSLESDEIKVIAQISDELCMNNALWYYKRENARHYKTIKKLIDREILKTTEDKDIFVVNPMFIRKGTPTSVLAHTMHVLSTARKVTKDMIHALRTNEIKLNQIEVMSR